MGALVSFVIGVGCVVLSSNALFSRSGEQHLVVQQPEINLAQLITPARSMQFRVQAQAQQAMLQPIAKIAMLALQDLNPGSKARDVSLKAQIREEVSHLDAATKSKLLKVRAEVATKAEEMAGVTAPMGLWDPLGLATDCSAGKLLFYREAELKHGRVGMIATLGLIVGERFHPFFGGNIDVPVALTVYEVPLRAFWSLMMIGILFHEFPSAMTFEGMDMNEWGVGGVSTSPDLSPVAQDNGGKSGNEAFFGGKGVFYTMRTNRVPGDFNFDPLGLKPTDAAKFKELQTKEINNGRLAMLAAIGIVAQEFATGKKVF